MKKLEREGYVEDVEMEGAPQDTESPKKTDNEPRSTDQETPKLVWDGTRFVDEKDQAEADKIIARTLHEIQAKPIANNVVVANAHPPSNYAKLGAFLNSQDHEGGEVLLGLAKMGLLQIAYDIGDERSRGIEPDAEYWGELATEAMERRTERIDRYLAGRAKQERKKRKKAKSTLSRIKEEPEEAAVKEVAPINWYPEVTAYVPASPTPGNLEEAPYVPKSPDPDSREVPIPDPAAERRDWEEIKWQLNMLEERVEGAISDLKTRMRELDDQVFRDGCLLTELNWKAEELKKTENQVRANRKRTHRRNDPRFHQHQTRSVTAAREKLAETQKQLDEVIGKITALEDRTEAVLAEIESIRRKIDKIMGLTPEIKGLAKLVEDHHKAQQDMNSVLMSEIASIKLAYGPTIESKLKTQSIEIEHLTSRVNQLHQVAITLLTSTDPQYASSYASNHVTPYAEPHAKAVAAF